ncbi:MAG: glycosyltransferase [Melioribacteraceae bacterium]|nr:MAG: glycosyltransferase [Melioribacteraceae bacterium]
MSTISLSMIVKNEEQHLEECLQSVKDVVDEIIVVDTGSNDNTIKIAESCGASVYHHKWSNDFSEARNFSLSKVTSDWVLYLDADERLDANSKHILKKLTSNKDKVGYRCKIYNVDEIHNKPKLQRYTRLFRNFSGIKFIGKAHEQIDDSLFAHGCKIQNTELLINHIGYNIDREGLKQKAKRNLDLLLLDYKNNPNGYCAFQIANSYSILKDFDSTYRYYTLAINDSSLTNEYRGYSLSSIAEYFLRSNDISNAFSSINEAIKTDSENMIANLTASQIYEKAGKPNEAIEFCKKALELNRTVINSMNNRLLDVILDDVKIIYHGLTISYNQNATEGIDFFFNKLEETKRKNHSEWQKESSLIQRLSSNSQLTSEELDELVGIINENNLDFYLALTKHYDHIDTKLEFDQKLIGKFIDNVSVKNRLGYDLSKAGKNPEAAEVFEKLLKENHDEATPVFYLIPIYLEMKKFDDLKQLIEQSKNRFTKNKLVMNHINKFEEKINSYLQKIN